MAGYAGDIAPTDVWRALEEDADAVLVDVRTEAEWNFVGVPDLSKLGKRAHFVEWSSFPGMSPNAHFVQHVERIGVRRDQPVYLLCRSGVRSRAAAMALTQAGFGPCYNIAEGFEGNPDDQQHRGSISGWKARGLPWVQQ